MPPARSMNSTNVPLTIVEPDHAVISSESVTESVSSARITRWRRAAFRGFRLLSAGGLILTAAFFGRDVFFSVESDQAYINAPILSVRAPIGGRLQLDALEPGTPITQGTTLFRVENLRFGNLETMSQLNWIRESVERLRAELAEAELRFAKQEQVFQHHDKLYQRELIPRLEHLEQENKVELCRATTTSKRDHLRSAEMRQTELERHLALQKQAEVAMPCDGVIWAVSAQDGSELAPHEAVLLALDPRRIRVDAFVHEKNAERFQVGARVSVRMVDSKETWPGRVESVRAGVGRVDHESLVAVPAGQVSRRRVAVRVKLDAPPPFAATQFYGVGRSVIVGVLRDD